MHRDLRRTQDLPEPSATMEAYDGYDNQGGHRMKCPVLVYTERHSRGPWDAITQENRFWEEDRQECSYTLDEVYEMALAELERFNRSPQRRGLPRIELLGVRWAE